MAPKMKKNINKKTAGSLEGFSPQLKRKVLYIHRHTWILLWYMLVKRIRFTELVSPNWFHRIRFTSKQKTFYFIGRGCNMCMFVALCVCVCVCMYIEYCCHEFGWSGSLLLHLGWNMYMFVSLCVCVCIYIYIYIYTRI